MFTKWVGQAWEELSTKKEMIIRSFKKFGISVAIDKSEATYADEAMDDDVDPFEDMD